MFRHSKTPIPSSSFNSFPFNDDLTSPLTVDSNHQKTKISASPLSNI